MADIIRAVNKLIAPIKRRVFLMVLRGVVNLVDDSKKCQSLQVSLMGDSVRDDVEHFQPYGFSSVPFKDAEALIVCVAGNTDHPIAAVVQDRTRRPKNLAEGDVALHRHDGSVKVLLKSNGEVHLGDAPSEFVALANLVKSELDDIKADLDAFKSTFDAHTHILTIAAQAGVGGTGTAAPPASPVPSPHTPGEVAAEEVKAK